MKPPPINAIAALLAAGDVDGLRLAVGLGAFVVVWLIAWGLQRWATSGECECCRQIELGEVSLASMSCVGRCEACSCGDGPSRFGESPLTNAMPAFSARAAQEEMAREMALSMGVPAHLFDSGSQQK